jgi:hypothetical protein
LSPSIQSIKQFGQTFGLIEWLSATDGDAIDLILSDTLAPLDDGLHGYG